MGSFHHTRTLPWPDRFWAKVEKTEGCWNWMAAKVNGYGIINSPLHEGTHHRAHRIAWEMLVGSIRLTLDHVCQNRACVNPDHLEEVTIQENLARAPRSIACPQGHLGRWTVSKSGWRKCLECHRIREGARHR